MILLGGLEITLIVIASIALFIFLLLFGLKQLNKWLGSKIVGKSDFINQINTLNYIYNFKNVENISFDHPSETIEDAQSDKDNDEIFAAYLATNESAIRENINICKNNESQYDKYIEEYSALFNKQTKKNDKHDINLPYFLIHFFESMYYQIARQKSPITSFSIIMNKTIENTNTKEILTFPYELEYEKIKETLGL